MKRVPEPELMADPAQAAAYAAADFEAPHEAFVEHFRRRFPDFRAGRVLDLGCGAADITLRFARAYPAASLLGVDGSEAMLHFGRQSWAAAPGSPDVRLERRYLPDPELRGAGFDALISNSLLHHLDDPASIWQTVREAVRPGGCVLVMDLLRPRSLRDVRHLVRTYCGREPEILQRDFRNSLRAAYRPEEVRAQLRGAGVRFAIEEVSDRHVIVWGTL